MITKKIEYLPAISDPSGSRPVSRPSLAIYLVRLWFSIVGRLFPAYAGRIAYRLFATPRRRANHKFSDPIIEKARLFDVLYGKQILKGYEWGEGDRNILLVHGWESRGTALRSFVPALVDQGFRVIAFDGPAHGHSTGKRTNLPHFGGAVRALINHIGGVYGIITHSFGGASTVFGLSNSQEDIEVEKLVLIATPNRLSLVLNTAIKMMGMPTKASRKFIKIIEGKLKRPVKEADISQANGKLKVKEALIVHDKNDDVVPFQAAEGIFDAWDNARLLVVEGMGHFKLLKHPSLIDKVVRFTTSEQTDT